MILQKTIFYKSDKHSAQDALASFLYTAHNYKSWATREILFNENSEITIKVIDGKEFIYYAKLIVPNKSGISYTKIEIYHE